MSASLHFEDLAPGQVFVSTGRTVTETDLTMFSMLSGDWNPIHADAAFMRPFCRIRHDKILWKQLFSWHSHDLLQ